MDTEHDKELDALDSAVESWTSKITKAVSRPNGGAGSLASLTSVVRYLGKSNKEVVHVLIRSEKEIRGIPELRRLLLDYFSCSHKTLEFLNTLQEWLHGGSGVSWRLDRLKSALREFKTDKTKTGYGRVLLQRALGAFIEANDPLVAERLRAKLGAALDEQGRLYERLRAKNALYVQTMKLTQVYRRVTTVILASVYISLMVCVGVTAVLTPALTVAPVAAIAAIAAMNPVDHTRTLMNHIWNKYEEKLRRRSELVNAIMEARTGITLNDLENIRGVVHALQAKIQGSYDATTAANLRKDYVLKAMIDDMEKTIDEFARGVKDLEAKKDKCYNDVMDARAKILGTAY